MYFSVCCFEVCVFERILYGNEIVTDSTGAGCFIKCFQFYQMFETDNLFFLFIPIICICKADGWKMTEIGHIPHYFRHPTLICGVSKSKYEATDRVSVSIFDALSLLEMVL